MPGVQISVPVKILFKLWKTTWMMIDFLPWKKIRKLQVIFNLNFGTDI